MWNFILALCLLSAVAALPSLESSGDIEIVGGHNIDITQAPYQISLRLRGTHNCGGSIISSTHVLTAAHCVNASPSALTINAGSTNNKQDGVVVKVLKATIHPKYVGSQNNFDHDYAVLKLAQPLQFSNKIKSIPLASQGMQVPAGQPIMISGWGWTSMVPPKPNDHLGMTKNESDVFSYPDLLKSVVLPAVDNQECQARLTNAKITNNMLCAGGLASGGQSACFGDSGGPAVYKGVLVGAVSFVPDKTCAPPNLPCVQAKVSAVRSWIDAQMN